MVSIDIQYSGTLRPCTPCSGLEERYLAKVLQNPDLDVDYDMPASMPSNLRVSAGEVMRTIQKFSLGPAAGGSGLHPNHAKELSKIQDFGHCRKPSYRTMTKFLTRFLS